MRSCIVLVLLILKLTCSFESGSTFIVNTFVNQTQKFAAISQFHDGSGKFVVVWASDGYSVLTEDIYAQVFDKDGNKLFHDDILVNTETAKSQSYPDVHTLQNGNVVVCWEAEHPSDGELYGIYGQVLDENMNKVKAEFRINTNTTSNQQDCNIGGFEDSSFVVTWTSHGQDFDGYGIYAQRYNSAGDVNGGEFQVHTNTYDHQWAPQVTCLQNGSFVIVWHTKLLLSDGEEVRGQIFNSNGQKVNEEFQVNTYKTADQKVGSLSSFINGNFLVSFSSYGQDGNNYGNYAQIFDSNGTKVGNEFKVSNYSLNIQTDPSCETFFDNSFVCSWSSKGQDLSSWGAYSQFFNSTADKVGYEFRINDYTINKQHRPKIATSWSTNSIYWVVIWESEEHFETL